MANWKRWATAGRQFIVMVLRGIGQVMLQRNVWAGILMLTGLAAGSWWKALAALAGSLLGMICARVMGGSRAEMTDGLYGFNGALVGLAVVTFFPLSATAIGLFLLGVIVATGLTRWFNERCTLPGFTAPFILSVWLLLALRTVVMPAMVTEPASMGTAEPDVWRALTFGWGQVMFEGTCMWTGLLFFAGVLVGSPLKALYGCVASALPLLLTSLPGVGAATVNEGLFGYNAVLCAIALGGKTGRKMGLTLFAVLLSIGLQWGGMQAGLPTLTAPFVWAVWGAMGLQRILCPSSSARS